jgi:glucose/arabinose dehydrogenase
VSQLFSLRLNTVCALAILAFATSVQGYEVVLDLQLRSTTGGSLLAQPVYAASILADPSGLYVVEQFESRIRRIDLNTGARTVFLDAPNIVSTANERGWKGMAFHPQYATNGKMYFHEFDGTNINIVEYTNDFNSLTDDAVSRRSILSFNHINVGPGHTAGWLGFSPIDNYLYIPSGDGGPGTCGTCGAPAQDLNDLRGKLLRIDVNSDDFPADTTQNYGIPSTNPFVGVTGRDEIFAYGLRNPWRAGFDSLNGDLYISDVGGTLFEEINLVPVGSGGGQNFGWRAREGNVDNPTFPDPAPPNALDPLYFYGNVTGAAVVGGPVYRGSEIPGFQGHYIFADFVQNSFASFDPAGGIVSEFTDRTSEIGGQSQVAAIAEAADGELYVIRRNFSTIYKIIGFARGDFNRDGLVDETDLSQWQDDYGLNGDSDADGDGDSDGRDYLIWQRQFGVTEMLTASVPEPATVVLLFVLAPAIVSNRLFRGE